MSYSPKNETERKAYNAGVDACAESFEALGTLASQAAAACNLVDKQAALDMTRLMMWHRGIANDLRAMRILTPDEAAAKAELEEKLDAL